MNLLPAKEAFEHVRVSMVTRPVARAEYTWQLEKTSWERSLLEDPTMLPLGLVDSQ